MGLPILFDLTEHNTIKLIFLLEKRYDIFKISKRKLKDIVSNRLRVAEKIIGYVTTFDAAAVLVEDEELAKELNQIVKIRQDSLEVLLLKDEKVLKIES